MASKQDKFFFDNLIQAAQCACESADYLVSCLENFDVRELQAMLAQMHRFEHRGDEQKHQMSAALAKAFVTPVDREDLDMLSNRIDDVTDCVEDVLQTIYVNHVETIPDRILHFARLIRRACDAMKQMMSEFENFKKSTVLHDWTIKLGDLEEEGDRLYLQSKYELMENCTDVMQILSQREILDKLENCMDTCEHVGDCVDTVVMKNN